MVQKGGFGPPFFVCYADPTVNPRRFVATLLALAVAAPLAAAPGDDLDLDRLKMARSATDRGDVYLRKQKYERAEDAFLNAIEHEKRYAPAYLGLGATLVATQRFAPAIDVLQEAERRFAEWRRLHEMLGLEDQQYNADHSRRVRDFARQRIENANPAQRATVARRTERQIQVVDRGKMIADRLRPDEVDGIPAQVFYLESVALLRVGRAAEGIQALETALFIDGDHALSHYNLAVALFVNGELDQAKQHLDAAVESGAQPHPQFVVDLEAALAEGSG